MMVDEKKHICESGAKELWKFAKDPRGKKTSDENLQTLRGILQSHRFTNNARRYLDSLVNRNITGVSAYKNIDGQRYDRVCLDFANQVCQNGKIGKQTAEALWDLALDGNRVTECEARTIDYVIKNKSLTKGAQTYLRRRLKAMAYNVSTPLKSQGDSPLEDTPKPATPLSTTKNYVASLSWPHSEKPKSVACISEKSSSHSNFQMSNESRSLRSTYSTLFLERYTRCLLRYPFLLNGVQNAIIALIGVMASSKGIPESIQMIEYPLLAAFVTTPLSVTWYSYILRMKFHHQLILEWAVLLPVVTIMFSLLKCYVELQLLPTENHWVLTMRILGISYLFWVPWSIFRNNVCNAHKYVLMNAFGGLIWMVRSL